MGDSARLSGSISVPYEAVRDIEGQPAVNASDTSAAGDSTKIKDQPAVDAPDASDASAPDNSTQPSFLGNGSFSLFGMSFNLFGSPRTAKQSVFISLNLPSAGSQPKFSLSQSIRAFFFGPSTTDSSPAQETKESNSSLLSWFHSKMFGSKPAAQPASQSAAKQTKEILKPSSSFNSTGGEPKQLKIVNKEVQKLQQEEDTKSFDNDVQRTFSVVYQEGSSTVKLPGETEEEQMAKREEAHSVLSEVSNHLFLAAEGEPESPRAIKLDKELYPLNPQGLIGCALKVLSTEDAPPKIDLRCFQMNFDQDTSDQVQKDCYQTISEEGSWSLSTPKQLEIVNKEVQKLQRGGDTTSFDNDVQRTFSVACKEGSSTVKLPGKTEEEQTARREEAHSVLSEVSNHLFPAAEGEPESPQAIELHKELYALNPQGLIACAVKVLSTKDAPEGAFSLQGGFIGTLTYAPRNPPREITLTATGTLTGNNLRGKLNGLDTILFSENRKATGTIEVSFKAQVDDNGHITSLTCDKPPKGSYKF